MEISKHEKLILEIKLLKIKKEIYYLTELFLKDTEKASDIIWEKTGKPLHFNKAPLHLDSFDTESKIAFFHIEWHKREVMAAIANALFPTGLLSFHIETHLVEDPSIFVDKFSSFSELKLFIDTPVDVDLG